MTTDELNAIVQAVMLEMEKAGVDFDFKAETPQADDLVYVMRGTADKYQGITVKWQNLLDIIVKKATDAKDEAVSAKDIALQTLATIQGIESNVSSMKSSIETTKGEVETLKSDVSTMKSSVEGTKTEVENIKEETAGLLDTKVDYSDSLSYEEIMATTDLTNKVASASALKHMKPIVGYLSSNNISYNTSLAYLEGMTITVPKNCIFGIIPKIWWDSGMPTKLMISSVSSGDMPHNFASTSNVGGNQSISCSYTNYTVDAEQTFYIWGQCASDSGVCNGFIYYWYLPL